jgi:hypothetical protein
MAMDRSLRSTGITRLHRYYEAVRPCPAHRYFPPRGWSRLRLFPWHLFGVRLSKVLFAMG